MAADNPVAFAAYLGRKGEAVAMLDRLARACGIRVTAFNVIDLNIPQDSPCHAGGDPRAMLAPGVSSIFAAGNGAIVLPRLKII